MATLIITRHAACKSYWHWQRGSWSGPARFDVALGVSRDGSNFTIVGGREPLVRPGRSGGYASRLIWVAASPVVMGDEIFVCKPLNVVRTSFGLPI